MATFSFLRSAPEVEIYDKAIDDLTISDLVSLGRELTAIARQADSQVHVQLDIKCGTRRMKVCTTQGTRSEQVRSPLSIGFLMESVRQALSQIGAIGQGSEWVHGGL